MTSAELLAPLSAWPDAPTSHVQEICTPWRINVNPCFFEWAATKLEWMRLQGDYAACDALRDELVRREFKVSYIPVGVVKNVCVVGISVDDRRRRKREWREMSERCSQRAQSPWTDAHA